jgi:hypothetical protein
MSVARRFIAGSRITHTLHPVPFKGDGMSFGGTLPGDESPGYTPPVPDGTKTMLFCHCEESPFVTMKQSLICVLKTLDCFVTPRGLPRNDTGGVWLRHLIRFEVVEPGASFFWPGLVGVV